MTREIASAVWEAINPAGVGVVIEACHMCMVSSNDRNNIEGNNCYLTFLLNFTSLT